MAGGDVAGPRICLINPYPPSVSPRLVRNADILSERGYDVVVVGTRFSRKALPHDVELPGRRWRTAVVDLGDTVLGSVRWQLCRARRKVFLAAARRWPVAALVRRGACYAGPELEATAARQRAALYFAHTHAALPAAARAALRGRAPVVFDAEDLLAEAPGEPRRLMRAIERAYAPRCALVTTMSQAAAERLRDSLSLPETPTVLHNTPSLREREGLAPPDVRPRPDMLSIYWFGQTVGPHSCAEQVVRALRLLKRPARLVLRGTPSPRYTAELRALAVGAGLGDRVEVRGRALPEEMVRLAGEHDVVLGSQPTAEAFHQMAIGNKVFTGLMAGTLLALTDTPAHRLLKQALGDSAVLFPNGDAEGLAGALNQVIASDDRLLAAKCAAWRLAEERFSWEHESTKLIERVERLIGRAPRSCGPVR
jgi:glycosyltransferase involved in cell wall biosynthesis